MTVLTTILPRIDSVFVLLNGNMANALIFRGNTIWQVLAEFEQNRNHKNWYLTSMRF